MSKTQSSMGSDDIATPPDPNIHDEAHRVTYAAMDLAEFLAHKSVTGRLLLGDERVLLIRQEALGLLRTVLIRSIGADQAEATLSHFGYLCGLGDYQHNGPGDTVADLPDTGVEQLAAGSHWLGWTGLAALEPLQMDFDRTRGEFLFRGLWRNSYEAELHLDQFGVSDKPVCCSLAGYTSGWCTAFFGQPVLTVETHCAAQGDECCQWEIRPVEEWGPEADRWRRTLASTDLGTDADRTLFADSDITAQLIQLRRDNLELTERARRRSEFLASMSRECRTSLTMILAPLGALIDTHGAAIAAQLGDDLRRIRRHGERLYRLVDEMLDVNQLEAGAMRPYFRVVDIVAMLTEIVADARRQADHRQISLQVERQPDLPAQRVDERMLEKCLVHLIADALHCAPDRGCVTVTATVTTSDLIVAVIGDRSAVRPDRTQKVSRHVQPTERDQRHERAHIGNSPGLALVEQFSRLHGGRVEVTSERGGSARSALLWPRRDASLDRTDEWRPNELVHQRSGSNHDDPRTSTQPSSRIPGRQSLVPRFERKPAAPAPPVSPATPPLSALTQADRDSDDRAVILVADDDPDIRVLIREILHPRFEVVEAEDGFVAWQLICARPPDVAVLDVMMPRLDGLELVARIKAEPLLRMIPCILITANASRDAGVSALDSGADDFLSKPFFADELSARVRAAARMRHLYHELHLSRARLSALEAQHSAVIDNASDGIVVFARSGEIRTWNRSMRQIFGYTEAEVLGRSIKLLCPVEPTAANSDGDERRLGTASHRWLHLAEFHSCEWQLQHKRGHVIDVESSRSEILINQEPLFVEVIRDIRERKRAQERLAEANRQLLSMSRVAGKAELATGVLHNVGNVLQSVKVNVAKIDEFVDQARIERLRRAVDMLVGERADLITFLTEDDKGKLLPRYLDKLVDIIARDLDRSRRAIADAHLGIEQIATIVRTQQENARTVLIETPVVLSALVGDVLRLLDLRGSTPRVIHTSGGDIALTLDRHRIVDILINLLENALDATDHLPADEREIALRTEFADDRLRISVTDNGVGIETARLTEIFAHGMTSKPDGRGFGLHVSALSAREMNGSLHAHSDGPGRGAHFVLDVPVSL